MATTTYVDSTFAVNAIGGRTNASGDAVGDYTAEEARFVAQILTPGYLKPTDSFKVTAQSSPNMTVKVGSGSAKADYYVVEGQVGGQGTYVVRLDVANQNVTITAADASQARTDEIYLVIRDDTYDAGSLGLPRLGYRRGDLGGAAPGPDAAWEAYALLASISVPALTTSIINDLITDERVEAGLLSRLNPDVISDHGALTGLGDDDHTQYHTDARGDARYYTKSQVDSELADKADTVHTHGASDITTGTLSSARLPTNMGAKSFTSIDVTGSGGIEMNGNDLDMGSSGTIYTSASGGAINGRTTNSSPWVGMDNGGPYMRFWWNGSVVQFVNATSNTVMKNFVIDHPTDSDRHLVHGCTESPHGGVEYWGEAVLKNGRATVTLPAYFEALTREEDRVVQVSIVLPDDDMSDEGDDEAPEAPEYTLLAPVAASRPRDGRFRIACGMPDGTRVSWLVKAVRGDVPVLDVEPLKSDVEVGGIGPYTFIQPKTGD
jgi:hypothetical protein